MSNPSRRDAETEALSTAFAEIPFVPAAAFNRQSGRARRIGAPVLLGLVVVGTAVAYLAVPSNAVDPNAPRVEIEVRGMHCPIQCGLRVAAALESLPWVIPGSVTANPKSGIVRFAVTSTEAVDQDQIRRAVENAGFGFRSVRTPDAASRRKQNQARTEYSE